MFLAASSAAQKPHSLSAPEKKAERGHVKLMLIIPPWLWSACCPHHCPHDCSCQERHEKITLERDVPQPTIVSDSPGSQLGPEPYGEGGGEQKTWAECRLHFSSALDAFHLMFFPSFGNCLLRTYESLGTEGATHTHTHTHTNKQN